MKSHEHVVGANIYTHKLFHVMWKAISCHEDIIYGKSTGMLNVKSIPGVSEMHKASREPLLITIIQPATLTERTQYDKVQHQRMMLHLGTRQWKYMALLFKSLRARHILHSFMGSWSACFGLIGVGRMTVLLLPWDWNMTQFTSEFQRSLTSSCRPVVAEKA